MCLFLNHRVKNILEITPAATPIIKYVIIRFIFSGDTLRVLLISIRTGLVAIMKKAKINKERKLGISNTYAKRNLFFI